MLWFRKPYKPVKQLMLSASLRREDVLNGLLEAVEQARVQSNPMAMIRGWVEIAKLMGLAAPERIKVDLNVAGQVEMRRLNSLSDAELLKLIVEGQAAAH
jgi:phage terminase small subunit